MGQHHIPYGRQWVDDDDVAAVVEMLRSDWLTTGPRVGEFEKAFAEFVGARDAVAVNSGTAALHAAMFADRRGARRRSHRAGHDVRRQRQLRSSIRAARRCSPTSTPRRSTGPRLGGLADHPENEGDRGVDYAGQPCDYDALSRAGGRRGLVLIADGCHASEASFRGRPVGSLAALTAFSFHPVKHITTGEGGMVTTDDAAFAARMRRFRNHGITTDARQREAAQSWFYEMVDLGFNYRLTDIQCALGWSQLKKLPAWIERRRAIASGVRCGLRRSPRRAAARRPCARRARLPLYVVRLDLAGSADRPGRGLRRPAPRASASTCTTFPCICIRTTGSASARPGNVPRGGSRLRGDLTLPLFPRMTDDEVRGSSRRRRA